MSISTSLLRFAMNGSRETLEQLVVKVGQEKDIKMGRIIIHYMLMEWSTRGKKQEDCFE